ncbi:glycosyltransferase [Candidatus Desantisbacteria bacterium]|nr:glycosyltransferase [Candidatus Desantisbacteria bacterium]
MNILFLTREIPYPANSGTKIRTFKILQFLSGKYKIKLFVSSFTKAEIKNKKDFESVLPNVEVLCGSPVSVFNEKNIVKKIKFCMNLISNLFSIVPLNVKKWENKKISRRIKSYIHQENVDFIICDSIYQTANLPVTGENGNSYILLEHNIESEIIRRYMENERFFLKKMYIYYELWRMKRYEAKIWNSAKYSFVTSKVDLDILKTRVQGAKADFLDNGVDTEYFTPGIDEKEDDCILYFGRMNWYPNSEAVYFFLTEIFPIIKAVKKDIKFFIIGKDPDKSIYKLAENDACIKILGEVEDLRPFLHKSKVVVVPIRIGSGTRLKILEAMAVGKPVVSTSIGCEGLDVFSGENILIADKPEDFAKKVIGLLNDESLRKKIGLSGRKTVKEKYDWEIINKKFSAFLSNLK